MVQGHEIIHLDNPPQSSTDISKAAFIEANTFPSSLEEIASKHIIPVFSKDNESTISQTDFIEVTNQAISDLFNGEKILQPNIRLSHPIKGRIPEAKYKPASQLLEWEKTIFFERMAFIIEVSSIYDYIDGNKLTLTIGGVKAYNLDNLSGKKGNGESFKVFIGFKNKVCTNLCVWSDGYIGDLKVNSVSDLKAGIYQLINNYQSVNHLSMMKSLTEYSLTESQFAKVIGKCRMYQHLPISAKAEIPTLLINDTQINAVCREYYKDPNFCSSLDGNISLWRLYNLLTGAIKSSYIDNFVDRSVNAINFTSQIKSGLDSHSFNWFLN
ncbi:DUF3871 family protein [Chitinophaga sp. CB10]|uniref:DUF3871 family protein n=1 Tax=Chitinophaga sp. CB10 TaxID=1891659 RepID=UPI000A8AF632|nr:DUF3871 family protein [Chitinophaga sp. CB10]